MSELIDRNKAYLAIEDLKQIHFDRTVVLSKAQEKIMKVPTVEPEPHWIPVTKEELFKAGYEGKEIRFRVDGRLFAIRELAQ